MLRRTLQLGGSDLLRAGPTSPAAACLGMLSARQVHAGLAMVRHATAEDALSSGKAPSSSPPDDPAESTQDFQKLADLYLGGLWKKVETGLRGAAEQKGVEIDAQIGHDALSVSLPEGGKIVITKDPQSRSLVVHSNVHDFYGSDGTNDEVQFRLQKDHTWATDGEELHEYLEDGLAKRLKVQVDLEPEAMTLYGPDPT